MCAIRNETKKSTVVHRIWLVETLKNYNRYSFDPFIPWYEWASEGKKDEKTRDFGHSIQHFSDVRVLQWYWYIIKKSRWSVSTNIRCKGILASELKKTDSNGFFNSTVTILEMIYRSASKIGTRAVAIINLIWQIFCETHL